MLKGNCPSCGAEIKFRSKMSVLTVCSFCRSNIVRHDLDLELLGKQSNIIEDMSPLQVACTGRHKNKPFWVLGKQTLVWEDGRWNEWYIAFQNNTFGWIAEAQGEFMILTNPRKNPVLPGPVEIERMKEIRIDSKVYHRIDFKKVECLGSEGELPFKTVQGSKSIVIDFSDHQGGFASVEIDDLGNTHVYVGEYTSLAKMKVQGLRRFEGWGRP